MLLQIHDPHQPTPSSSQDIAIGIDLGTTNTVLCALIDEKPTILQYQQRSLIPSVVKLYSDGSVIVGEEAFAKQDNNPTVLSIKRLIAKAPSEPCLTVGKTEWTPITLTAEILKFAKKAAEESLGQSVSRAVITVPAYFDDSARAATKRAAQIAGIDVLRLLNEPTAAALAYGLNDLSSGTFLVYDLGGGTFDVSILKSHQGILQVLSTAGDTQLGGDDFDALLFKIIVQNHPSTSLSLDSTTKPLIQTLKKELSYQDEASYEWPMDDHSSLSGHVTRQDFEAAIQPLIHKTLSIAHQALLDAGVSKGELTHILLVGGSTRMPSIQKTLREFFHQNILCTINPDEVVAMGASIQASALTVGSSTLLLDVIPISLGIETMGGLVEKIIPRNTPIPTAQSQVFTTFADGQTSMTIHVIQGERELVKDCRSLAKFSFKNISPRPAGTPKIQVTFQVDADGLLTVSAQEEGGSIKQSIDVNPSAGLLEKDIIQHLNEAMGHAHADMQSRLLAKAKVESSRLIEAVEKALAIDAHLMDDKMRNDLQARVSCLAQTTEGEDLSAIQDAYLALEGVSREFANLRIQNALSLAAEAKGNNL